jgi:hypothetical protein
MRLFLAMLPKVSDFFVPSNNFALLPPYNMKEKFLPRLGAVVKFLTIFRPCPHRRAVATSSQANKILCAHGQLRSWRRF